MKKSVLLLTLLPGLASAQAVPFALHNGDRVVFYGDSITDQRLYTLFTEAYVRTRYPILKVEFTHSGWGGDRVTGGGGGGIDTRLARDVYPYRPTVMTIMLGMNDAGYKAFDQGLFDTYQKGYEHILSSVRAHDPGVRFTLIQPSPYDDVTRAPSFPGGYNATLLRYSDLVGREARNAGASVADLNTPVVAMLGRANATDPATAQKILPDRVHPGPSGHLIMAESLLKAWNAMPLVSSVSLDSANGKAVATGAKVSDFKTADGNLAWTQTDDALPFPLDLGDPVVRLAVESSDFVSALDNQTLAVAGLNPAKSYDLQIDGAKAATFTGAQLAAGVNLATLPTPMLAQAKDVLSLVRARADAHNTVWRNIQVPNERTKVDPAPLLKGAMEYDRAMEKAIIAAAKPKPHRFRLVPSA